MASGMPSSRAHTCATAAELCAVSSKAGLAAAARAANSRRPRTRRPPRPSDQRAVPAAAPGRPAHREHPGVPGWWPGTAPAALGNQRGHQARRRRQDVLAVVQHHQQLTLGQFAHQSGGRGGRIPFGHPQGLRDAGRDQRRVGERGQLDQPGPVAEAGLGERRRPQRQPGLAAPARAGKRDRPGRAEAFEHGSYLGAAAHQRAHLGRQPRLPLRKTCRRRTSLTVLVGTTFPMTWLTASYDLAGREIPPSADAAGNGNRESFPHRYITDPGGPDELHLTRADSAHYDLRLAERPHGRHRTPAAAAPVPGPCD